MVFFKVITGTIWKGKRKHSTRNTYAAKIHEKSRQKKNKKKKYLIPRIWQDSFSQGFIFGISTGKYEKRPLNFAIKAFSNWFYFSKSLNCLNFLDKLEQAMCEIFAINVISHASKTNQQFVYLLNIMYVYVVAKLLTFLCFWVFLCVCVLNFLHGF